MGGRSVMSAFRRMIMMAAQAAKSVRAWFYGEGFFYGEGWFYYND